jgi:hypothetical protein
MLTSTKGSIASSFVVETEIQLYLEFSESVIDLREIKKL